MEHNNSRIRLFFFVVFIPLLVTANSLKAQPYSFGIDAGVNISSVDNPENLGVATGYHIGIIAAKELNAKWSLRPGLLFSVQGANQTEDELKLRYYYINLPVHFNMRLGESFGLIFGPQFSTLLHATRKDESGKDNITSLITLVDLSLCAGFNVIVNKQVQLQVNYNIGLLSTSASDEDKDEVYPNMVFQAGMIFILFNKE